MGHTALIDTGSKMDDVIYKEFKGTGNRALGHLWSSNGHRPASRCNRRALGGHRGEGVAFGPEAAERAVSTALAQVEAIA